MKKKIAVIINGDLAINRQGQVNSAINRVKHLMKLDVFDIDVYCIQEYDDLLLRVLHHQNKVSKQNYVEVEGLPIKVFYKRKLLIDSIFESFFKLVPLYSTYCFFHIAKQLKGYDLIVGHSTIGGVVALKVHECFKTKFCVIWHGSDIHTNPVSNNYIKEITRKILKTASANVFVSNSLLKDANSIFNYVHNPHVAYNAPSEKFVQYCDDLRVKLRKQKDVFGKKVVAFVGNLVPVKNVFTLPGIFKRVRERNGNVVFWIVGNGIFYEALHKKVLEAGVSCKFLGNRQPEEMPEIMNCIDVVILPSLNESFGMVLVEAIACGAHAVGSKRGGIPEVIGIENCFELDNTFEERIAERIDYMLNNDVKQSVNPDFEWKKTALKENEIYQEII